jgi:hypothetical protein
LAELTRNKDHHMFDFSHLPNVANGADVQVFRAPGQWQSWIKPRGKSQVKVICLGAGAGGGAGFSAAAATARGGGGGGGGGALNVGFFPAFMLPDVLFCFPGLGGLGGTAAAGGAGTPSAVLTVPDINWPIASRILVSGGANAGGGGVGTAAAGGALGVAASTPSGATLPSLAQFQVTAAAAATAGGAQTGVAGAAVALSTAFVCGGAGGGGTTSADFAGGGFTATGWMPSLAGGAAGSNRGQDGYELTPGGVFSPVALGFAPGTGGGSSNAGVGGAGGNAGPGCGGGGGGAGATGGKGGDGGHGMIIIASW